MDLSTRYLGLTLEHPLMLGASPLVDSLDTVRRIEDAGASAIVMHSLFEEQIAPTNGAHFFRTSAAEFALSPDEYLEQIRRIKAAVKIPLIGSLNGVTDGAWLDYAKLIDQAGADALELNVYQVEADADCDAAQIEQETADMVRHVKSVSAIPLAVKLSPFYSALANFAARLSRAGADGLVLFNRFYQPDFHLEKQELVHQLELSSSSELLLRLRWLAILSAQTERSLAASGGVHSASDALKALIAGASGVQLVSEILKRGPHRFGEIRRLMESWLQAHDYHSIDQLRGGLNLEFCPEPRAHERARYLHVLNACSRVHC
ncbi:MAG TPA: dihydroorotate dehydrogenase-like protein [Polyangiaceae bacterium]|jgi:dihydroorotate dehydrogenase (fumarate)